MKLAAPMAALVAAGFAVGPAAAQDSTTEQSGQRIAEIIVFGNDPCPRSTDDEVVVCIQSCSPVGPAGYTGCMEQMINDAREESREAEAGQTPPGE